MEFNLTTKEILFTLLLLVGKIKWFRFRIGPRKTAHSGKANHSCFDEVNACADVCFRMILFRVVFAWQFITQNEISFLSKWSQWKNSRNEFHFVLYQKLTSYKKLTIHRNENIWFHPEIKSHVNTFLLITASFGSWCLLWASADLVTLNICNYSCFLNSNCYVIVMEKN